MTVWFNLNVSFDIFDEGHQQAFNALTEQIGDIISKHDYVTIAYKSGDDSQERSDRKFNTSYNES